MAFIPAPECVKIALNFLVIVDTFSLVFHARTPAAVLPSDCAALAGIYKGWAIAHLMSLLSFQTSLEEVVATDLTSLTGSVFHDTVGLPFVGGNANPTMPVSNALCVTLNTALRGRSYRGRSYVAGMPSTAQSGPSHFTDPYTSSMQAAYEALPTAVTAGGYIAAILSERNAGAPRVSGVTTPIVGVRANVKIATQRRRLEN